MNAARKPDRHGWLRGALADKGLRQNDVSKAWGCDDAVVSRFISTGTPELTWDRALSLSAMLGMELNELKVRIAENVAPRRGQRGTPATAVDSGSREDALGKLKRAVAEARAAMPDATIEVSILQKRKEQL